MTSEAAIKTDSDFKSDCNAVEPAEYYKIVLTDKNSGLKAVAFVGMQSQMSLAHLTVVCAFESQPCNEDWSCEEWAACTNGTQKRNCDDLNKCSTTGNKPVTSKSCQDAIKTCTESDWSSTLSPSTCPQSEQQTKIWIKTNDCNAGVTHPSTESITCDSQAPTCTSFTYSLWESCTQGGTQTRTIATSSPSGCTGGSPVTSQSCIYVPVCSENWSCTSWTACSSNGTQTKTCTDLSSCGTTTSKPSLSQNCTYHAPIEIKNDQVFPYDATQTTNPAWKAYVTSNGSAITGISIKNNWSYNQPKTETSNSKLMLVKDGNLNFPQNYIVFTYKGLQDRTTNNATIGGSSITITDTKGILRTIPLVIELGSGTNEITIGGKPYIIDVNKQINAARYWTLSRSSGSTSDPWGSSSTPPAGYADAGYTDKGVNTGAAVGFTVDADWENSSKGKVNYYLGADETNSKYWLFLAVQDFGMPSSTIGFNGTYLTNSDLRNYYLPDTTTYNVLTGEGFAKAPSEGDSYSFTAKFSLTDEGTTSIYTNTSTGYLVNSTDGKSRLSAATAEVIHPGFILNEYSTGVTRLTQGYTYYGTKISVGGGVAQIYAPSSKRYALVNMYKGATNLGDGEETIAYSDSELTEFSKVLATTPTYSENVSVSNTPLLQTIADGITPGEVALSINQQQAVYNLTFIAPIQFNTSTTISLLGKTYTIIESSSTRILLQES
ncbi:MAG: hypothetical protein NTZ73_01960 [Candidatus Diapherotrites archaeon]|nr:hypothetical protein [Candidatus Diapherotrites archaeon]